MLDYRNWMRAAYLVGAELLGWTLLLAGLAMLLLPGPGILGVFAGLVVLSTRYEWARKLRHHSKEKVEESMRSSVQSTPRIVMSVLFSLLLIGWGLVLAQDPVVPERYSFSLWKLEVGPHIPGAGLVTGIIVVASAIVALLLVSYSAYRYRRSHPAG